MTILILGLVIFLGVHSTRIVADDWRTQQRARMGANRFKLAYTVVSLIGFALIVWGFSRARLDPIVLWVAPPFMRHVAALFSLIGFVLLAAAYVPRNGIKARVHHPMALGVTFWAFGHLLSNGTLAEVLLFGSFLVWSKLAYLSGRKRDRVAGTRYAPGILFNTAATVLLGVVATGVFALWLHQPLIGVAPFAR